MRHTLFTVASFTLLAQSVVSCKTEPKTVTEEKVIVAKENLKETIFAHYQLFKQNNLKVYPVGLQYYSRKSLTEKLVKNCLANH